MCYYVTDGSTASCIDGLPTNLSNDTSLPIENNSSELFVQRFYILKHVRFVCSIRVTKIYGHFSVKNKSVSLFFLVWKKLDDNNLTIVKQIPLIFSSDHSVCQKLLCFLNYQLPSDMQFDINPGEMIGLGTLNSTVNNPLFYFTETESHVQVYSTNGLEYNVISNSDLILDYIATPQLQIEYAKAGTIC